MFFSLPWMLLGLLGLPLLAGIYWLRSRSRPRMVSSLFLWSDQRNPRQGGRRLEKLQTPLTFFLELLALAAIALAAAAPGMIRSRLSRPLVLVLDDSYSMQAGNRESVRELALRKLRDEFEREEYVARVILAGREPHLLSDIIRTPEQLAASLTEWTCLAPAASLDSAIALAGEIGGETARILVVSDHPPQGELSSPRMQWWGLGTPRDNLAFTAASRSAVAGGLSEEGERLLLEVTNFSKKTKRAQLSFTGMDQQAFPNQAMELAAGAASRMILSLPPGAEPLQAQIEADELTLDNHVWLLSPRRRPLRVQLAISQADPELSSLRAQLLRAFEATGETLLVDTRPDLLVTNQKELSGQNAHQWSILTGPDSVSYEGPFILNRSHPLTTGLSLDAVIWSAPAAQTLSGNPLVAAGNRVLMTELEQTTGHQVYQMLLIPQLSSLTGSPDWPILVTNLVRECLAAMPGPSEVNLRLEQPLTVTLSEEALAAKEAEVIAPDGSVNRLPVHGKRLELRGNQPGVSQVKIGSMEFSFACNALSGEESDLSECATGQWGQWDDSALPQDARWQLDWICILLALGCLVAELMLLSRWGVSGS